MPPVVLVVLLTPVHYYAAIVPSPTVGAVQPVRSIYVVPFLVLPANGVAHLAVCATLPVPNEFDGLVPPAVHVNAWDNNIKGSQLSGNDTTWKAVQTLSQQNKLTPLHAVSPHAADAILLQYVVSPHPYDVAVQPSPVPTSMLQFPPVAYVQQPALPAIYVPWPVSQR